jgi:hypothetical protein
MRIKSKVVVKMDSRLMVQSLILPHISDVTLGTFTKPSWVLSFLIYKMRNVPSVGWLENTLQTMPV